MSAQTALKPVTPPLSAEWQTKSFELKYVDPEQLSALFSNRSFVMEANRDLKTITAHGSAAFLKEVEDAVKHFDVPPPAPSNILLTVYLVTTDKAGAAIPKELAEIAKEVGAQQAKLADMQVLRIREGQSGQVAGMQNTSEIASLSRVTLQSASLIPGAKGDLVSLYGLRVSIKLPPIPGSTQANPDSDISADIDIAQNQTVIVSKAGTDKPLVLAVRATVVH